MSDNFYSASRSRTQGRNTWAVIFRHPKRTDPTTGKEGLRVRQSLKTDNEQEAALLRDQMNALLASPQLWDLGAAMKELVSSGNSAKPIFAFTHFDKVSCDHLPSPSARSQQCSGSWQLSLRYPKCQRPVRGNDGWATRLRTAAKAAFAGTPSPLSSPR